MYTDGYTVVCKGENDAGNVNPPETPPKYSEGIDIMYGDDVDYWAWLTRPDVNGLLIFETP